MTGRALVEVAALPHHTAVIVQGALQAEGIPVFLEQPALAAVYGLQTGAWATRVRVPAEHAQRALALLAEIDAEAAG